MSAGVLREAASLMRERAEAASPSDGVTWGDGKGYSPLSYARQNDAEHIASWHPTIALLVSDVLEGAADSWTDDPGCDLGGGYDFSPPCEACFRCFHYEAQMRAEAVARAYLRGLS